MPHKPLESLHYLEISWSFHKYGNLLGLFPLAIRQLKHMIVTIDYFTEWIEVEPLSTIFVDNIKKFM